MGAALKTTVAHTPDPRIHDGIHRARAEQDRTQTGQGRAQHHRVVVGQQNVQRQCHKRQWVAHGAVAHAPTPSAGLREPRRGVLVMVHRASKA